ncbi:MAG TPA: hypothetical protein VF427_14440 [Noviherbaspirillum sp.]
MGTSLLAQMAQLLLKSGLLHRAPDRFPATLAFQRHGSALRPVVRHLAACNVITVSDKLVRSEKNLVRLNNDRVRFERTMQTQHTANSNNTNTSQKSAASAEATPQASAEVEEIGRNAPSLIAFSDARGAMSPVTYARADALLQRHLSLLLDSVDHDTGASEKAARLDVTLWALADHRVDRYP